MFLRSRAADGVPAPFAADASAQRPFTISVVCSGNICRSPMAAIVLRAALADAGLGDDEVRVTSAGTGPWWAGSPAHESTRRVLQANGFATEHVAHPITAEELSGIDLLLAADRGHVAALNKLDRRAADKTVLLRSFDPNAIDAELPDPYYGPESGFDDVMTMVQAAVPGVVAEVKRRLR